MIFLLLQIHFSLFVADHHLYCLVLCVFCFCFVFFLLCNTFCSWFIGLFDYVLFNFFVLHPASSFIQTMSHKVISATAYALFFNNLICLIPDLCFCPFIFLKLLLYALFLPTIKTIFFPPSKMNIKLYTVFG